MWVPGVSKTTRRPLCARDIPYLLFSNFVIRLNDDSAICYAALGSNFGGYFDAIESPISVLQATVASLVVSSGCIAFSDVVADGIVVQRTRESDDPKVAGGLQSLCWGSVSLQMFIWYYNYTLIHTRF